MSLRVPSSKSSAAIAAAATILLTGAVAPIAGASARRVSGLDAAQATTTLPPGLITLEQRMEQLQVSSERFSMKVEFGSSLLTDEEGSFEVTGKGGARGHRNAAGGKAIVRGSRPLAQGRLADARSHRTPKMIPLLTGTGERSLSQEPGATETAVLKAKVLGALPMEARVIGERGYLRTPVFARLDGGRPWVRISRAELSEQDDSFAAPTGPGEGAAGGLFAQLPKELELAEEVTEVGGATVDGKRTTEFAAKLNMGKLLESLTVHEPKEVRSELGNAKATLDVFFEPDGLPLRTSVAIRAKAVSVTVAVDVLAVNIPVEVSAPPADETISAAQLKALEKRNAGKALKGMGKHEGKHSHKRIHRGEGMHRKSA